MDDIAMWASPLLLKPGVALLILSTSTRFGQLHEELHRQLHEGTEASISHLRRRARLLHSALVNLYTSVGVLAFASLFGAALGQAAPVVPRSLMFLGVCIVTFASIQLIRESRLLMTVIDDDLAGHPRGEA